LSTQSSSPINCYICGDEASRYYKCEDSGDEDIDTYAFCKPHKVHADIRAFEEITKDEYLALKLEEALNG
jgi:hypothetical protein